MIKLLDLISENLEDNSKVNLVGSGSKLLLSAEHNPNLQNVLGDLKLYAVYDNDTDSIIFEKVWNSMSSNFASQEAMKLWDVFEAINMKPKMTDSINPRYKNAVIPKASITFNIVR